MDEIVKMALTKELRQLRNFLNEYESMLEVVIKDDYESLKEKVDSVYNKLAN